MTLRLLLLAIACLATGGASALFAGSRRRLALISATAGALAGGIIGVAVSARALFYNEIASARFDWSIPAGELHVGVDPLSSFFLLCIFTVTTLSALYGAAYLASGFAGRSLSSSAFSYNVLVVAMVGVVVARDGVLFLFAWEIMTVASFLLVAFEHEREDVARASLVYLATSHVGTAFLFLLFSLLAAQAETFDFTRFTELSPPPFVAGVCFVLALVGFGTKAGLWPLHFWLPQAHGAAPSHVSAVMSGVMIELGIYGILRTLGFIGTPAVWWGVTLLAVGSASALLGVLGALGARDLKKLVAYSSIENLGIIALALGLALVLRSRGAGALASLAVAGALFHVWNHALFKSVLFQCAGVVQHETGTRDLEQLGGLGKRMPRTALPFLVAALGACALPPLNGFVSEWVIYLAAFKSALSGTGVAAAIMVIPVLALVGGLAAAALLRAFGISLLGEPRSAAAREAHDASRLLTVPLWIGGALCLASGMMPQLFFQSAATAALWVVPEAHRLPDPVGLAALSKALVVLAALATTAVLVRSLLLARREVRTAVTWDCGYAAPSARMQYTASSFAEPVLEPFDPLLTSRISALRPKGYFPIEARYEERVEESGAGTASRFAQAVGSVLSRVTVLQLGRIQVYLLYILVTLIAVLAVWMPR